MERNEFNFVDKLLELFEMNTFDTRTLLSSAQDAANSSLTLSLVKRNGPQALVNLGPPAIPSGVGTSPIKRSFVSLDHSQKSYGVRSGLDAGQKGSK